LGFSGLPLNRKLIGQWFESTARKSGHNTIKQDRIKRQVLNVELPQVSF
jgi:hypothetical protein